MPGAYTHITMANQASEPRALRGITAFSPSAIEACGRWLGFCELGAVSPDYPYLHVGSEASKRWADKMHYERTGDVIKTVVRRLRSMRGTAREKGLAWVLGYTAHVVMDVTMHPVVNLKVGPYEENKTAHRICEMNQDVHIFQSLGLSVRLCEHLDTGIRRCVSATGGLDEDIRELWTEALTTVHPDDAASNPPDPDTWHKRFGQIVDSIESTGLFEPISRHVASGLGIFYPKETEIDVQYIKKLPTPAGPPIDFDALFARAKTNVHHIWTAVASGVEGDDAFEIMLGDWNLDTGEDMSGRLVFW